MYNSKKHRKNNNDSNKLTNLKIFKKIWKFVLPFKLLFILALFFNFLFSIFSVLSITLIKPIIEIIFGNNQQNNLTEQIIKNTGSLEQYKNILFNKISYLIASSDITTTLLRFGIVIFLVFLAKNIFKMLGSITNCKFEENVIKSIRDTIFKKINTFSLDFFHRHKMGNLISIITNDVTVVNQTMINSVTVIIREGLQTILFLILLLSISIELTLITFIAGILTLLVIRITIKYLKRYASRMQQAMADFTSTMSEIISGIRIVKVFSAENTAVEKFKNDTKYYVTSAIKHTKITSLVPVLSEISAVFALIIVLFKGGLLVINAELTSADLMLFLFSLFSIMTPIITITNNISLLPKGIVSSNRIFSIIDTKPTIKDGTIEIQDFKNSIEFKNVQFKYTDENNIYVLNNINLKIERGKQIALVGASGSGKSTLLDLIIRFYDPSAGEILIDGINLKQLKISQYRKLFGIVSQENILFNDTIKNNITYGMENISDSKIEEVAKIANCYNFIQNMPNKFNTQLGDRGVNISGGERQRIAIARALIRNPHILMFDEATSALDAESEKLVQEAINNSLKNKTALIIAHRLSTIINCDEIIVFDKGYIVERGTHQELLSKNGIYKKLYDLQYNKN